MDYDHLPKMTHQFYHYSNCASFYDENKMYIAVVGDYYPPIKTLIFDIGQNVWFQGIKTNDTLKSLIQTALK